MTQRYGRSAVLGLATQQEEGTVTDGQTSGERESVVVHSDGGRVNPEEHQEAPTEIPPAYDSIPADEHGR
jgi:hypothetical protein